MPTTGAEGGGVYALLKEVYPGELMASTLNEECVLLDAIEDATETLGVTIGGGDKGINWPVHLKRSGGAGAIGEGLTLPTSGTQTRKQGKATGKELAARTELTKKVMETSKRNEAAFASIMESEMNDLKEELRQVFNRQLFGNKLVDGNTNTGIIAQVLAATGADATVTIDGGTTLHLYEGMLLRFGTAAAIVEASTETTADTGTDTDKFHAGVVSSITDISTFELVTAPTDIDENNLICVGDANFYSYNQELTGLAFIVDDADSLFNINPATAGNERWKSHVNSSGGGQNMSHEILDAEFDIVKERSGKRPDFLICHATVQREIKKMMEGDVRYEPTVYKGGYERKTLVWNNGEKDVPIHVDKHATAQALYFLCLAELGLAWEYELDWVDDDSPGSPLRMVANKLNFEQVMACSVELVTRNRRAHGVITDINVNTNLYAF